MATRKYDFDVGIETASQPLISAPVSIGDVYALGAKTSFTVANNQGSAANITGLIFDKSLYRSFIFTYQIYRSSSGGSTRAQCGMVMGITDGTSWEISGPAVTVPASGDAGLTLSITSAGQIGYVSDDNGGTYDATKSLFEYEILQLMAV